MENTNKQYVIWIDPKIDIGENIQFSKILESKQLTIVKLFKEINEAIKYMKEQIKFEETKVILSAKLYSDFVNKFKENIRDMNVAPKIIVFTNHKQEFIQNNQEFGNDDNKFYKYGGVVTTFNEILKFLEFEKIQIKETKVRESSKEVQFTFQYINNIEDLMLPLFFKSLIDDASNDNMEEYTNSLYNTYSQNFSILKILLGSIQSMKNVPIEILSKYYARLYTSNTNFYKDIKEDLRKNKVKKYLPFIKTLYEGVKLESLKLATDNELYRGSLISNEELKNIIPSLNKKNKNLPPVIAFSNSFLSFSKNKEVAEFFLRKPIENKNLSKVLYILEKDDNIGYNLSTHADIEDISLIPKEKEVLFFPFSSFEIKDIDETKIGGENVSVIKLLYLGKYLKEIEKDNNLVNKKDKIPESEFKKQLIEFGLIEPETIKTININGLYNQYKLYEDYIKKKNMKNKHPKNNYILGEIKISSNDINKDIQIINSFENFKRIEKLEEKEDDIDFANEKEIKENVEIRINGKRINFSYVNKFNKEGKYKIEYLFKKNLERTNHMFYSCTSLTNLNLSNFKTQNVINMGLMFSCCNSLTSLNLSNFNTQNVTDMHDMFSGCNSLKDLNLSNFNTQNVTDMSGMFFDCKSLTSLKLSNFKTQNVEKFYSMFSGCSSLKELDLSNFNIENATHMQGMFYECTSLKKLNLSNFNAKKAIYMKSMFYGCNSLKKESIITKSKKILNNFDK